MEINKFKKLEETIIDQDFNKNYININRVMFFLSIFGQLASIFLAYFLVSKVLTGVITQNPFIVNLISLILLVGLELLKREIFDKFSFQYLKLKNIFNKDVLPLLICSIFIVSISFYASINGAKEFSNKSKDIQIEAEKIVSNYEDSLNNVYNLKIQSIENDIKSTKNKIDQKDQEQTELESSQPLTFQEKSRIKDLKEENNQLRKDNIANQVIIDTLKNEAIEKIKNHGNKILIKTDDKKNENKNNSYIFIMMSTIIEFIILIGVYFNKYFKFRSYKEFKNKIDKDPNYQKWILFDSILDIIYSPETKINDRILSTKSIIDICKINRINLSQKDVTEYMKILNSINIIKTSGNQRYFIKTKEISKDICSKYILILNK